MRISDWSSDVCSSDLLLKFHRSATSLKSDRADVLMLAQRIISPAELSERSGRSSQSVVVELKRFNIPRIAFGWDRRVISKMQQFAEILLRFPRARFSRFPEKDSGHFFAQYF